MRKVAEKMLTSKEKKNKVSKFESEAWSKRKETRRKKVAKKQKKEYVPLSAVKNPFIKPVELDYTSKTKRGECKNINCKKSRRSGSAFCQKCSDDNKLI